MSDDESVLPVHIVSDEVAIKCGVLLAIFLFTLPLIICDFFFAFNSISCQLNQSSYIALNLKMWLIVMASLNLFANLFTSIFLCFSSTKKVNEYYCFVFFSQMLKLVITSWTIVGCILFWRDISFKYNCSKIVENYMWARLIIQVILTACDFFSKKEKENKANNNL